MIIPLAKRQNADTLHAIADPIAASGPSDGQAPSFELSEQVRGGVGKIQTWLRSLQCKP